MHCTPPKSQDCPRALEPLEARTLLSGHVSAVLRDRTLYVTGSDSAEIVRIDRKGLSSGAIRVSGDAGTTINGRRWPAEFAHDVREVKIDLGGGDDRLTIERTKVKGDLRIDLGAGDDFLRIAQSRIWGNLDIRGGDGASSVQLRGTTVGDQAWIGTGNAPDRVNLGASEFDDAVKIKTRDGNDQTTWAQADLPLAFVLDSGRDQPPAPTVELTWDFLKGVQGWVGDFADYQAGVVGTDANGNPITAQQDYELASGLRPLPAGLGTGTGYMLSGINRSDDLFMFLKREVSSDSGVIPGQFYRVEFTITFGSNAPTGAIGVGGPPGEAVAIEAGATPLEPLANKLDKDGVIRTNVYRNDGGIPDKPSAASGMGNFANGIPADEAQALGYPYVSIQRSHTHVTLVPANSRGEIWLLTGTDSGYEGKTTIYYQRITVKLIPV